MLKKGLKFYRIPNIRIRLMKYGNKKNCISLIIRKDLNDSLIPYFLFVVHQFFPADDL